VFTKKKKTASKCLSKLGGHHFTLVGFKGIGFGFKFSKVPEICLKEDWIKSGQICLLKAEQRHCVVCHILTKK